MKIETKIFDEFVEENFPKFRNIKKYPLNEENVRKWVLKHRELGTNYELSARITKTTFKNVSFVEFMSIYDKICEELCILQQKYKFYIKTNEIMEKSDFFCAVILYYIMKRKNLRVEAIMTDIYTDFKDYDKTDTLVLMPDDAMYSGEYLTGSIKELTSSHFKLSVFPIVSYMSLSAKTKLFKSILDENLSEEAVVNMPFSTLKQRGVLVSNFTKSFMTPKQQNIYNFGNNKQLERFLPTVSGLYFDFKLSDSLSCMATILAYGYLLNGEAYLDASRTWTEDKNIEEIIPLITNCEYLYTRKNLVSRYAGDLRGILKNKVCPVSVYKTVYYTLNGRRINDVRELSS